MYILFYNVHNDMYKLFVAMSFSGEICHCNPQCSILIENLQCLREILMHMLLTKPDEERERIACLTDVSKQDRQNAAIIDKLELELIAKNSDKNEEVSLLLLYLNLF